MRYECIIVIGRGEAELSSRSFLRKPKMKLNIAMVAIMDFDSHEFQMLSCYRYDTKLRILHMKTLT
ncbi:hypothetical protein TSUD_11150 [Trifolium subterraneum]|nr:hypothetical protein TSUD_11150 [Trifolium subterraneum]